MRKELYGVKLLSGETVAWEVGYGRDMESKSDTRTEVTRSERIVHRVLIPQPVALQETDQWQPARPRDYKGERIQVTAHANQHGEIVERWQFSDEDVRWYRIEIADLHRKVLMLKREDAPA